MITNSVVPMPNAPAVSAYSANGVRARVMAILGMTTIRAEAIRQLRQLPFPKKPPR
jgi:hypothetical protein